MTEEQFLLQQAEAAKQAIANGWEQIKDDLKHGVDVRLWAQQYPLAVAGGALVAGFLAANAMVPSKEDQALRKLGKIQAAMGPAPAADGQQRRAKPSFLSNLTHELFSTLRPAIVSALTAGVATQQSDQGSAPAEPGHESPYATQAPMANAAEI